MIDNVTKPWRRVLFEQDEYTQRNHINIYGFRALVNGVWGAMERISSSTLPQQAILFFACRLTRLLFLSAAPTIAFGVHLEDCRMANEAVDGCNGQRWSNETSPTAPLET